MMECFGNLSESLAQFAVHFLGTFAECDQAILLEESVSPLTVEKSVP